MPVSTICRTWISSFASNSLRSSRRLTWRNANGPSIRCRSFTSWIFSQRSTFPVCLIGTRSTFFPRIESNSLSRLRVREDEPLDAELRGAPRTRQDARRDDEGDEEGGDDHAVGALAHVLLEDEGEDTRREEEIQRARACLAPECERHGDRGREHEHEDARRVRAALRVHVGPKRERDDDVEREDEDDEGPRAGDPRRGHPEPGKVAGDQVQDARHRGGAGEPQDRDRGEVVERPEGGAEVPVREPGERAPARLAPSPEGLFGNEKRRDEARREEKDAHEHGRAGKQLARAGDPRLGLPDPGLPEPRARRRRPASARARPRRAA